MADAGVGFLGCFRRASRTRKRPDSWYTLHTLTMLGRDAVVLACRDSIDAAAQLAMRRSNLGLRRAQCHTVTACVKFWATALLVRQRLSRSMSRVPTRAKALHFAAAGSNCTSKPALVSTLTRDSTRRCAKRGCQLANPKVCKAKLPCRAIRNPREHSHFA